MRRPDAAEKGPPTGSSPSAGPVLSIRDLSHELNSRLDGAMRSVRLAERAILDALGPAAGTVDEAMARLHVAQDAMRQMATMLENVLDGPEDTDRLAAGPCRLDVEAWRTIESLRPLAEELDVDLRASVDPAAAELEAGPLGIVLHNGLRNAVRACAAAETRRVDLEIRLGDSGDLSIRITDTGAGLRPDPSDDGEVPPGHGLGLALSRRIVARLGGELTLVDASSGTGAVFGVTIPGRGRKRS